MNEIDARILQVIEELRDSKKMKLSEIYESLNMSKQNIYSIKNKDDRHFTVAQINYLVKKYNIDPGFVFGLDDKISIKNQI